jgi:hypothetical protein
VDGGSVYILADNNMPGKEHAQKVAENLCGIVDEVRIVNLPGLAADEDVANWLDHGNDHATLIDICKGFPLYRRSEGAPGPGSAALGLEAVSIEDFHAYMPMHTYIFVPSGETWPASSVNARLPQQMLDGKQVAASKWLDRCRAVEQMTWAPGQPMLIKDRLVSDGGWIERPGCTCFNLYRPPVIVPGDPKRAGKWIEHVRRVCPDDAEHIIKWLAHRVQRPHEKVNHALVLGGNQGIGKDTILEPVKRAIGPWNFVEVSPQHMLGCFNGFAKSVILRISEARDLGDNDRFKFYDHLKVYTAAPPDVLRVDEKNLREYSISNVCGVIITTNNKTDGIYLPADDRRNYVAWSPLTKEDFTQTYWDELYDWYANGGNEHVAAYLANLDLSGFNAKAPPPKTAAFWAIVDASRSSEDAEFADVIDSLGHPDVVTIDLIAGSSRADLAVWLRERKNRRIILHRLEAVGYTSVRNPDASDGLFKFGGRRQAVYAGKGLSLSEQIAAARRL